MKYGIIIQARTGSKRLPNKIFLKIGSKTILQHIVFSLKKNNLLNKAVIATTKKKEDRPIINFCKRNNIKCFTGNSSNVLKRFYLCNKKFQFKNIIRLTADNPFINIYFLKKLIKYHINSNYEYTTSMESLPIGMGSEIFSERALKKSYFKAKKKDQCEHVNEYILQNKKKFKIKKVRFKFDIANKYRFTVDTIEDYNFLKSKYKKFKTNFKKYYSS